MLQANVVHRTHQSTIRTLAALALVATAASATRADDPSVVYEHVLSEYGNYIDPHDVTVDPDGNAYILAARWGSNYATLVIKLDPAGDVIWSEWFDGAAHDIPGGIALDAAGDVYVVGTTGSDDFPLLNPLQAERGSVQYDAFVMKLAGTDGQLLYSTFLGASRSEWGYDIAVNDAGEIYIAGSTESLDFPLANPIQDELAGFPYYGWSDGYIAKISADGSELLYSTFFGGYMDDSIRTIALDAAGRIYVAGETDSDDFPTVNPAQSATGGNGDAFAARLSADGGTVEYSTYLGGEEIESTRAIAVGPDDSLYFAGHTQSIQFPTTTGAYQEEFAGEYHGCEVPFGADYNCDDAFVARLNPDGSDFSFVTYLGGEQIDHGYGLAVDALGNAYVTGHTRSDDFPPYASGTFYTNFVTKLDATGSTLRYSYLHDVITPSPAYLAIDAVGDLYVAATVDTPTILTTFKLTECGSAMDGDMDCTGEVDLGDYAMLSECLAGPGTERAAACARADLDTEGHIDLRDFAELQQMIAQP